MNLINLHIKKKYHLYLETDEWKRIATHLKSIEKRCQCCGNTHMLEVHHITYDNLDLLKVGSEKRREVATICSSCHEKAHNGQIFFIVPKTEDEYESFREILSNSKTSDVNNSSICYLRNIKTKLCDIENSPPDLTKKQLKQTKRKPKVYLVCKTNYNKSGYMVVRAFGCRADAEQYIKESDTPWRGFKIKEMPIYQ